MSRSLNTHLYVCSTNRETNGLITIEEVHDIHEDHYIYKYNTNMDVEVYNLDNHMAE